VARRSSAITIADVAKHAGVSPATVSRVMNGRFLGEPEVAERVRASARELSYWPNQRARSFAMGQTNAIAFLVPDLANPSFQVVLAGLSKAAGDDGYRVMVADSAEAVEDEPLLAAEIRRRCDAVVLCAPRMSEAALVQATEMLAPVVLVHRFSPAVSVPTLTVDSRQGAEGLARYLHGLGHRRFAYVAGPSGVANENRLRGLADFEAFAPDAQIVHVPGGAGSEQGVAAADEVLRSGATAVLAFNDLVAIGVVHGLLEREVPVPEQISVTGFDDIPFARYMAPSLTTASVPQDVLGELAWNRMHALIRGETPEHNVIFQPRLEVRRSTAPPPA